MSRIALKSIVDCYLQNSNCCVWVSRTKVETDGWEQHDGTIKKMYEIMATEEQGTMHGDMIQN